MSHSYPKDPLILGQTVLYVAWIRTDTHAEKLRKENPSFRLPTFLPFIYNQGTVPDRHSEKTVDTYRVGGVKEKVYLSVLLFLSIIGVSKTILD